MARSGGRAIVPRVLPLARDQNVGVSDAAAG
jgi:hypothetical protein